MKQNYKLTVAYDGTKYLGWQRLPGHPEKTVQGKIEAVLSRMYDHKIEVVGSGRTDGGVHARAQVANFIVDDDFSAEAIRDYLNEFLPEDIAVTDVEAVAERFHSRYNAKSKTYLYRIYQGSVPPVFERKYVWHVEGTLDLELMKNAAGKLIGTHDFEGFASKSTKKSTVRTIQSIEIIRDGQELTIAVTADGFLYNMVRILVGTLVGIGKGLLKATVIDEVFETKHRPDAGETAPAQGLILYEVYYEAGDGQDGSKKEETR